MTRMISDDEPPLSTGAQRSTHKHKRLGAPDIGSTKVVLAPSAAKAGVMLSLKSALTPSRRNRDARISTTPTADDDKFEGLVLRRR